MSGERDNFKSGLFLLAGVILAMVFVFTLADLDAWMIEKQRVRILFHLDDGLKGLKIGSAVTLGDQPVGEVESIEVYRAEGRLRGHLVIATIPAKYRIHRDAVFELVVPPLGSGTRLNIRSVGSTEAYDPEAGEPIPGTLAGSDLTRDLTQQVGIQQRQRRQIQNIISNIERLTDAMADADSDQPVPVETIIIRFQKVLDNVERLTAAFADASSEDPAPVERIVANLEEATGSGRRFMTKLEQSTDQDIPEVIRQFNESLDQVKATVDQVASIIEEVKTHAGQWWPRIDQITESVDETTQQVRTLVQDKDPTIRRSLDNVEKITQRIRDETIVQINEALAKADQAIENVRQTTSELDALMVAQRPTIERAIANAQITTGQLKLAAIEIRRSPWRLLYKPSEEELETDNLYDAARSFALAAGTLDAAADSLRAIARDPAQPRQRVERMLGQLESLFGRFEQAEQGFWKALGSHGAVPTDQTDQIPSP